MVTNSAFGTEDRGFEPPPGCKKLGIMHCDVVVCDLKDISIENLGKMIGKIFLNYSLMHTSCERTCLIKNHRVLQHKKFKVDQCNFCLVPVVS
jgi:hypothetical protein